MLGNKEAVAQSTGLRMSISCGGTINESSKAYLIHASPCKRFLGITGMRISTAAPWVFWCWPKAIPYR
jgi:hypothetical protein